MSEEGNDDLELYDRDVRMYGKIWSDVLQHARSTNPKKREVAKKLLAERGRQQMKVDRHTLLRLNRHLLYPQESVKMETLLSYLEQVQQGHEELPSFDEAFADYKHKWALGVPMISTNTEVFGLGRYETSYSENGIIASPTDYMTLNDQTGDNTRVSARLERKLIAKLHRNQDLAKLGVPVGIETQWLLDEEHYPETESWADHELSKGKTTVYKATGGKELEVMQKLILHPLPVHEADLAALDITLSSPVNNERVWQKIPLADENGQEIAEDEDARIPEERKIYLTPRYIIVLVPVIWVSFQYSMRPWWGRKEDYETVTQEKDFMVFFNEANILETVNEELTFLCQGTKDNLFIETQRWGKMQEENRPPPARFDADDEDDEETPLHRQERLLALCTVIDEAMPSRIGLASKDESLLAITPLETCEEHEEYIVEVDDEEQILEGIWPKTLDWLKTLSPKRSREPSNEDMYEQRNVCARTMSDGASKASEDATDARIISGSESSSENSSA
jgi:hypothetical protein